MEYRKFDRKQRSTFPYWFWHWLAFNATAVKWGAWRPRHLFHDIEKPFMKLFMPYKKLQKWHRAHNRHHLEYRFPEKRRWEDMVIDWECSRLTKKNCPLNAIKEAVSKLRDGSMSREDFMVFKKTWRKMKTAKKRKMMKHKFTFKK